MSPVALKWKSTLKVPAIASAFVGIEFGSRKIDIDLYKSHTHLSVAHNASEGKSLLEDWMRFTNILGGGILIKIS